MVEATRKRETAFSKRGNVKRKRLAQLDLLGRIVPCCPFCGYPGPSKNFRCEYELAKACFADFNPFKVNWHVRLDEEERLVQRFIPLALQALENMLPEIEEKIERDRLTEWALSKCVKRRSTCSQFSLLGFLLTEENASHDASANASSA
jgi:hypothetical protein